MPQCESVKVHYIFVCKSFQICSECSGKTEIKPLPRHKNKDLLAATFERRTQSRTTSPKLKFA